MHLRQAVMEMGQNAIEWGNRHQSDSWCSITYRIYDDRVEIVIRDQGPGFDRANMPHAATPDDPLAHLDVREKLGLARGLRPPDLRGDGRRAAVQRRGQRGDADQAFRRRSSRD